MSLLHLYLRAKDHEHTLSYQVHSGRMGVVNFSLTLSYSKHLHLPMAD